MAGRHRAPKKKKSRKWLYYFVPILVLLLVISVLFLIPGTRNRILDLVTNTIFGSSEKDETYDPEKNKEEIKEAVLDFYHAYQDFSTSAIIALTEEPLTTWEENHCLNLKKQEAAYNQPEISLDNLSFEFKNVNNSEAEVVTKRQNVLEVPMPFKFGETTQGDMSFRLKKNNGWKIINRTYNNMWVSKVY